MSNKKSQSALIEQWLRNKDTLLFLGAWEHLDNPNFNFPEFVGIKNDRRYSYLIICGLRYLTRFGCNMTILLSRYFVSFGVQDEFRHGRSTP